MSTVRVSSKDVSFFPMALFALCCSISGISAVWNYGLIEGFREYLLILSVSAVAATCVGLCLTELTSALPLTDGVFGIVRSMINPFAGFMIGINEITSQLVFISHLTYLFGTAMTYLIDGTIDSNFTGGAAEYQPFMWILLLLIVLLPGIKYQHSLMWRTIIFYGVLSILLMLIYIIGSSPHIRTERYPFWNSENKGFGPLFRSGIAGALGILPYGLWIFRGVDVLPLTCSITSKPRRSIPIAIVAVYMILIVVIILSTFIGCSQWPGAEALSTTTLPFLYGFSSVFNISKRVAAIFIIPFIIAGVQARIYAVGQTLRCMAGARLLPEYLEQWDHELLVRLSSFIIVDRSASAVSKFSYQSSSSYGFGRTSLTTNCLLSFLRINKSTRVQPMILSRQSSAQRYVSDCDDDGSIDEGNERKFKVRGSSSFDAIGQLDNQLKTELSTKPHDAVEESTPDKASQELDTQRDSSKMEQPGTVVQSQISRATNSPTLLRRQSSADLSLSVLPRAGMVTTALIVFLLLLVIYVGGRFGDWNTLAIINISIMGVFINYLLVQLGILLSFVLFRLQFHYYVARRKFYNAWGLMSAVFSTIIIFAAIVGIVVFPISGLNGVRVGGVSGIYALAACLLINMFAAAIYIAFLRDRQTYSAVEETVRSSRGKKDKKSGKRHRSSESAMRDFPIITNRPSNMNTLQIKSEDTDECATEDDTNKTKTTDNGRVSALSFRSLFSIGALSNKSIEISLKSSSNGWDSREMSKKKNSITLSNGQLPAANWEGSDNLSAGGGDGNSPKSDHAGESGNTRIRSNSEEEDLEWEELMRAFELQPMQNRLANLTPAQQREIMQLSRAMVEDDSLLSPIREGEYEDRSELSFGSRLTGRRIYRDHSMSIMSDVSLMS